jgi:hypothetical protein
MGIFSRRHRVGDTARIVDGEYAGMAGRILSFERSADGEEAAVILIDDWTVPTVPLSALTIDEHGLLDMLDRADTARDDPSTRDLDYEKLRRSGRIGIP